MAEARAQDEESAQAQAACLKAEGLDVVVRDGSALVRNFGEAALPPDVAKAQEAAMKMCAESSPAPDYRQESAGVAYEHMLDFVACVENEGYPLPAPPTRETSRKVRGGTRSTRDSTTCRRPRSRTS